MSAKSRPRDAGATGTKRSIQMKPPKEILRVWKQFDDIPMETLTKAWWYRACDGAPRQRSVAQMEEHRNLLGCGGNCFDLAIWLLHAFEGAGVRAHAVGHDLRTPDAHVAVVAFDEDGYGYLCDLGDQWLQPVLVDPRAPRFTTAFQQGFFAGAHVSVAVHDDDLLVRYRRPNGKESRQQYDLRPIAPEQLMEAADQVQRLLRHPLVEIRRVHPTSGLVGHWEFSRGVCRWSLDTGLVYEDQFVQVGDWVRRIHEMTGIALEVIRTAFEVYRELGTEMELLRESSAQ